MQHLSGYIAQRNLWADLFKRPKLDAGNLTPRQMQYLMNSLEADLSPENLTCDGELRGAALREKQRMLNGSVRDLRALAKRQGVILNEPTYAWE